MHSYERDKTHVKYLARRMTLLTVEAEQRIYKVGISGALGMVTLFLEPAAAAILIAEMIRQGYLQARARDRCEGIRESLSDRGVSRRRIAHFEEGGRF